MATTFDQRRRAPSKFKRTESLEFRLIFAAAFLAFLGAAVVERMLPRRIFTSLTPRRDKKSIVNEAKDAANTCAAYAFMG